MSSRARATGRIRVLTLAAVVLALSTGALPTQAPNAQAAPLAAGSDFTISSTISSSATSADPPALLYPGVTRYLWFRVSNPLPQPITVTSLGITRVDAPTACPLANLDLGDPTFTGAVVVPARGTTTVPAPKPIALINLPDINQDACKNVTFTFTFAGTGWYTDSPNLAKMGTATVLVTTPRLAAVGTPVTLTARVIPTATLGGTGTASLSSGGPTGIVTFYLTTPSGRQILLGTGTLGADGAASLRITSLPPGAGRLHAVYGGADTFDGSTSPAATLSIVAPPAQCTATYTTSIIGAPESPVIAGTSGNDFIYAVGADYRITAGNGNDCVVVGDGNNVVASGSGADVVIAGNGRNTITALGSRNVVVVGDGATNRVTVKGTKKGKKVRRTDGNVVTVGNGAANRVTVGKGSKNVVTIGNGAANRVTMGKGSKNVVTIGNGKANRVTVRKGSKNAVVTIGNGSANRVTVNKGSKNLVTVGDGARNRVTVKGSKNRVKVGKGTANRVTVGTGTRNRITIGNGGKNLITVKGSKNKVILGKGKRNRVVVRSSSTPRTTCSLPTPPRSWRGKPVGYYRDTLIRCRVVTR